MISMGDVFAQGIIGAVQGAGQAGYASALEEQKQQSEAIKEQRLSQLRIQEHAADKAADLKLAKQAGDAQAGENAQFYARTAAAPPPRGIVDQARGTYETDDGPQSTESNTVTTNVAPSRADVAKFRLEEAKKTGRKDLIDQAYAEDKDIRSDTDQQRKSELEAVRVQHEGARQPYYEAQARLANANADDIEANGRHREALPQRPSIMEEKDINGNVVGAIDRFSGARMRIIPASPEVAAKSHLFGADEPGKPGTPSQVVWTMGDKVLPGGIADLYPDLAKRSAPKATAATPAAAPTKAAPPQALPLPGGKGNAKFTGRYSAAGHPLYQGPDGNLFEGR